MQGRRVLQHRRQETPNALQRNEGELELAVLRGSLLIYGFGNMPEVRPCLSARRVFWSLAANRIILATLKANLCT